MHTFGKKSIVTHFHPPFTNEKTIYNAEMLIYNEVKYYAESHTVNK